MAVHARSALLGWVKQDAAYIAELIAARASSTGRAGDQPAALAFELRVGKSTAPQPSGAPPTA
jgi:hypothetical protein